MKQITQTIKANPVMLLWAAPVVVELIFAWYKMVELFIRY